MRVPTASFVLTARLAVVIAVAGAATGGAVAGCGTDSRGLGGTGGATGSHGGDAGGTDAGSGGRGGSTVMPGADAATDSCEGMPIPAIACAFGRTVPICALVVVGGDPPAYRWQITCPDQPPPVDAAVDRIDASTGNADGGSGGADAATGVGGAGGTGVGGAGGTDAGAGTDARADTGSADAGTACASSTACGSGQVCTTADGVCNAPPGCGAGVACPAVCYGTCRPADAGPTCGNTICGAGTTCCNASCGTCVAPGMGCTKQLCVAPACEKDSDCQAVADYCTGCDCRALTKGTSLPECPGPGVQCLVDACLNKVATCVNRQCVVAIKG